MALSASDSLASFDTSSTRQLDLSPVMSAILLNDTAFLGLIGMGQPVLAADHRWNEDSLNAPTVTADSDDLDAAGSETTLTLVDASKLRIGALLMDQAVGLDEVLQVTAISGNDVTVTRGYGSTSPEDHGASAVYAIVGQPVQEGDETIADISRARSQKTQYTQIFKRTVKVSGTAEAEANNGLHPGIASEVKYQLMARADELKVEMDRAALNSIISSSAGSDSVYRTMKGLREYLTAANGNHTSTAEALSETVVNDLFGDCWDDGGDPGALIGHADQITKFANFNSAKLRVAPSDRVAGVFVEKFLTSYGKELTLVTDRWMKRDEVALIDTSRVYIAPLKGRALFTEPLAKIGDALRWQLVSEATLIVRNALEAHAYHSRLTV